MMKIWLRVVAPLALILMSGSAAAAAPGEVAREVRVEIVDPADAGGGVDVTTSLVGERACSEASTDDGAGNRRKVQVCVHGEAVHVRLERVAGDKRVEVTFGARPEAGKRVRIGRMQLAPKHVMEAFVTVNP